MNNIMIIIIALLTTVIISGIIFIIHYIRNQNRLYCEASETIRKIINGNENERISCNKEGKLYNLFHDINTLASILNSQADKEAETGVFLKKTIQDISHQLKTPISALTIYNEILQDENLDVGSVKKFTELSEQELNRINNLVENLLKITKLDSKTVVMDFKSEKTEDILMKVYNHFYYRAEQEDKQLTVISVKDKNRSLMHNNNKDNIDDDDYCIKCDSTWMTEALDNIVKNALDHTNKNDEIELSSYSSGDMICIQVKDNGNGIHEEDVYHIFKRFYRSRFSSDKTGIGLGLSLSKSIIESHGGSIEVNSTFGKGTVFSVFLPKE